MVDHIIYGVMIIRRTFKLSANQQLILLFFVVFPCDSCFNVIATS